MLISVSHLDLPGLVVPMLGLWAQLCRTIRSQAKTSACQRASQSIAKHQKDDETYETYETMAHNDYIMDHNDTFQLCTQSWHITSHYNHYNKCVICDDRTENAWDNTWPIQESSEETHGSRGLVAFKLSTLWSLCQLCDLCHCHCNPPVMPMFIPPVSGLFTKADESDRKDESEASADVPWSSHVKSRASNGEESIGIHRNPWITLSEIIRNI